MRLALSSIGAKNVWGSFIWGVEWRWSLIRTCSVSGAHAEAMKRLLAPCANHNATVCTPPHDVTIDCIDF